MLLYYPLGRFDTLYIKATCNPIHLEENFSGYLKGSMHWRPYVAYVYRKHFPCLRTSLLRTFLHRDIITQNFC